MTPFQSVAALSGFLDDPWPVGGRDVTAVTPLPDGNSEFADVLGHRFRVVVPGGEYGGEM